MTTEISSSTTLVKLIGRAEVAERTTAFYFEKPPGWTFEAGQFVEMTLLDPPETDAEGNARAFSLASAPHEESLMVATRMRDSAFKRVLSSLRIGQAVAIDGPFGSLTLPADGSRPVVCLAGGIGITPFRSMVRRMTNERLASRLFLFYANRRPEDAAFLDEFQDLEGKNPNFEFAATMTQMEKSRLPWKGHLGHIDWDWIQLHVDATSSPIYCIAGPPRMVRAMQSLLKNAGVEAERIRAEEFGGY